MMRLLTIALLIGSTLYTTSAYATDVREVVSPGGIRAWLVEEHVLPLVAVKIAFRGSGTAYDPPKLPGRANMEATMLMEGAGEMDSRAFNAALEDTATRLNFGLDEDLFHASLVCLSQNKEQAFSYMASALTSPRFDESAMDRVRSQSISLLKQQEREPAYLLHRQWEQLAFNGHPYSNPVLGTQEGINAITKADLSDFTHRYLTKENIVIAAVGDITAAELGAMLDAKLGNLPEHYNPDVTVAATKVPAEAKQVVVENDIPQTMVIFGENGIKREDPDFYASYVMNYIFGGGNLNSRLITEIREKRGLAYSASSQLEPMNYSALWAGGFATRNEKVGGALQVLRDALKSFSQDGPTDLEMADAKKYLTGSFVLSLDSNADIASYLISMQIHHLGTDYLNKRNQLIEAVTKEQVKAAAKKLLDPNKLLVVMVGKPSLEPEKTLGTEKAGTGKP